MAARTARARGSGEQLQEALFTVVRPGDERKGERGFRNWYHPVGRGALTKACEFGTAGNNGGWARRRECAACVHRNVTRERREEWTDGEWSGTNTALSATGSSEEHRRRLTRRVRDLQDDGGGRKEEAQRMLHGYMRWRKKKETGRQQAARPMAPHRVATETQEGRTHYKRPGACRP
ncbi:hypothetical protein C8R44DRAFT_855640 [Mycena epipterygia]|nr:hypothetical protein C8R44DRAFT_855640 [Mycena epipterygia]